MKKILVGIFAFLTVCFFFSCKQEDDETTPPSSCTVTLYANGGSMTNGSTESTKTYTVSYGAKDYLPSASDLGLTRENFFFLGWAESTNATEYKYQDEAYIQFYSDLTLYAVWKATESETFYISANGSDETGTGTEENPFATLAKATEEMTSRYADYAFIISGAISTETISFNDTAISSSLSANSITISGATGSETDSISPKGSSSIFVISTTRIPVLIKNITLKNGSGYAFTGKTLGGAVHVTSSSAEVSFSNVVFTENTADYGAAVFSNGIVTFSNCTFTKNSAQKAGGALHNEGTMIVEKCTISGNSSSEIAGGIYNKLSFTLKNTEISENTALSGGGIYNSGTIEMDSNCTISKNSASTKGAGIYNDGTFSTTGGTISENKFLTEDGIGAGIYNSKNLTLKSDVKNHTVATNGAALYNDSNGTVLFAKGKISENSSENGGAIFNKGSLTIAGGTITKNSAVNYGGAVYSTGSLTITYCNISSNMAKNGGGIALCGDGIEGIFSYGTISSNTAENGGGFYIEDAIFSMTKGSIGDEITELYGQIKDNIATSYGGGVYLKSGTLIVNAGIISAYGKRKITYDDISGTYIYSGNKAGANSGTATAGIYANCGNAWFSENGTIKKSGEVLTGTEITVDGTNCHYSDEDVVVGIDGWSATVGE